MRRRTNPRQKYQLWKPALWSILALVLLVVGLSFTKFPQALTIKGRYITEDSRVFRRFLNDIKENHGVLVIGTSETGNDLGGFNYWGFLNQDKTVKRYFSVLGGAGRDVSIYLPILLKNGEAFRDLQILIYVNPTYWRDGLCNFENLYFTRYVGKRLAASVREASKKQNLYEDFIKPARYENTPVDSLSFSVQDEIIQVVDDFRSYFYYDLQRLLKGDDGIQAKRRLFNTMTDEQTDSLKAGINLKFNTQEQFLSTETPFPEILEDCIFRYSALQEFIKLCKKHQIRATFYLGPYNAIYAKMKNPDRIAAYEDVIRNIKLIINTNDMPLIDGTNLSSVPGTFLDVQHISKYGAFLTAQQIKNYYAKDR